MTYPLRQLREKHGLKRAFVAAQLGITPDHLNKIERGDAKLTDKNAGQLKQIYKVDNLI